MRQGWGLRTAWQSPSCTSGMPGQENSTFVYLLLQKLKKLEVKRFLLSWQAHAMLANADANANAFATVLGLYTGTCHL